MSHAVHTIQLAGTDQSFSCAENDTLLRAALRNGIAFPYECNVGSCGNCKFELLEGVMASCWPEAPGLSDKDRARNRGLGCQSRPTGPLQIKLRTSDKYAPQFSPVRTPAKFIASRVITHDLSEFTFQTDLPLPFLSGQYALIQMDGIAGPRTLLALAYPAVFWLLALAIPYGISVFFVFTTPDWAYSAKLVWAY